MRKGLSDENTEARPAPLDSSEAAESPDAAAAVVAEVIAVEAVVDDTHFVEVEGEPSSEPIAAESAADEVAVPADVAGEATADDSAAEPVVYEADPALIAATDQARAALAEITPAASIGEPIGHVVEGERLLSLLFESKLAGYPDWHWVATLSRASEDAEPTVLEVELLPGDDSVLSPAWVPWADRVTPDQLIDDSESEFDDDDVDDEAEDESADDRADDDDAGDSDLDDDSDDDEDDDEEDELALTLRRDRDGIDIDTIAEEGLDIDGIDDAELDRSSRLLDSLDDAVELEEQEQQLELDDPALTAPIHPAREPGPAPEADRA